MSHRSLARLALRTLTPGNLAAAANHFADAAVVKPTIRSYPGWLDQTIGRFLMLMTYVGIQIAFVQGIWITFGSSSLPSRFALALVSAAALGVPVSRYFRRLTAPPRRRVWTLVHRREALLVPAMVQVGALLLLLAATFAPVEIATDLELASAACGGFALRIYYRPMRGGRRLAAMALLVAALLGLSAAVVPASISGGLTSGAVAIGVVAVVLLAVPARRMSVTTWLGLTAWEIRRESRIIPINALASGLATGLALVAAADRMLWAAWAGLFATLTLAKLYFVLLMRHRSSKLAPLDAARVGVKKAATCDPTPPMSHSRCLR